MEGRVEVCLNGVARCVKMAGMSKMLELCVDNWDTMEVRFCTTVMLLIFFTASPVLVTPQSFNNYTLNTSLSYHLHEVQCSGNESMLIGCRHNGVTVAMIVK